MRGRHQAHNLTKCTLRDFPLRFGTLRRGTNPVPFIQPLPAYTSTTTGTDIYVLSEDTKTKHTARGPTDSFDLFTVKDIHPFCHSVAAGSC